LHITTPQEALPVETSSIQIDKFDLVELYQSVNPGVVTIWTYTDANGPGDDQSPNGQGSGFVIDKEGHIVTNQHVVIGSDSIEVAFPSGYRVWATVVGLDPDSDLAVLKVEVPTEILLPLTLGDSSLVQVGESVVAIGNPFGLSGTMTSGIISAIGRTMESERAAPTGGLFSSGAIIQTDAAINPGNSGGPLLNLNGEVIGVNRAIRTDNFTNTGDPTNSGVGFAIPVNIVRRVVPYLIADGFYSYPYLGVQSISGDALSLPVIEELQLPENARGAYVTCVTPGGPAEAAGVIGAGSCTADGFGPGGDLIVAIDEVRIMDFIDLISYLIMETEPGSQVVITVLRDNEEITIPVTIGARP
jgi:2-alkenal reductase